MNNHFKIPPLIDWSLLSDSISNYTKFKYEYIEVPWIVNTASAQLTWADRPSDFDMLDIPNNTLVGSAEQSFIEMMNNGDLKSGQYCALTPCWRAEKTYDEIHYPWFMKTELIDFDVSEQHLENMIYIAADFFYGCIFKKHKTYIKDLIKCVEVDTNQYDLMMYDVEIGSYGIRKVNDLSWIYGTGLAEPRFSHTINNNIK